MSATPRRRSGLPIFEPSRKEREDAAAAIITATRRNPKIEPRTLAGVVIMARAVELAARAGRALGNLPPGRDIGERTAAALVRIAGQGVSS